MSCGQVASSQPLAHNRKFLPLRDLRNALKIICLQVQNERRTEAYLVQARFQTQVVSMCNMEI